MRGSSFSLFSSAYFTEGPICLGPLPVSFFLTENYRQSPCERPAHDAQKSAFYCGYPGREIVGNKCWLVCGYGFV